MQVLIDSSDDARLAKLLEKAAAMPSRALPALARGIWDAAQDIVGAAVAKRFNTGRGPFPVSQHKLGVKSGRLKQSIRSSKAQVNLRTGELSIGFGSNVAYFAIHEFGFEGSVNVKAHRRRLAGPETFYKGKLSKKFTERRDKIITRRGSDVVNVRAHSKRMKVPARKPLGTELEAPSTKAAFLLKIKRALNDEMKSR